jgi:hypothetical protein
VDRKIPIPSLLMIRTIEIKKSVFQSLDCFQVFQKTMPISDWQISRVEFSLIFFPKIPFI